MKNLKLFLVKKKNRVALISTKKMVLIESFVSFESKFIVRLTIFVAIPEITLVKLILKNVKYFLVQKKKPHGFDYDKKIVPKVSL